MAEVIVALDLPRGSEALRLLDRLPETRWVKVGPVLMTREGARFVDTLGGLAMMQAAAAAAGGKLDLLGVTVLTSHDSGSYARALGRAQVDLSQEATRLALAAVQAGLRGVVCSAHEVSSIRRQVGGEPLIVVPGIRRLSDASADQVRVATAKDAAASGATHLVVGRPVLQAPDPAAAFHELVEEARCVHS